MPTEAVIGSKLTCLVHQGKAVMMRHAVAAALSALLAPGMCSSASAADTNLPGPPELLTNLFQLRRGAEQRPFVLSPFRIVAEVMDADCASGVLALRDSSGSEFIEVNLGDRNVKPGTTISLEGAGYGITLKGFGLALIPGMVVDNDGLHGMITEPGKVVLRAGAHPIAVQWFNRLGEFGLNVEYEGPGLPRQRIPPGVLFRQKAKPGKGDADFSPGLNFRYYQHAWGSLPNFSKHHPVRTGVATNFDLSVRTRDEAVGLEFNGFIRIPNEGIYTFYLTSDDGSRLLIGESSLEIRVLNNSLITRAVEGVPETVAERDSRPWATLEGVVKFAGVRGAGGELVMRVGDDDIRVEILGGSERASGIPSDTKVRVSGVYQDVVAEDSSRAPGRLLVASWNSIHQLPSSERISPTGVGLRKAANLRTGDVPAMTATASSITTAAEVKALPAEQAKQQRPVSVRGVVTALLPAFIQGAVVQDSTKGIYISLSDLKEPKPLQLGEYCQVDGVTGPGLFAPLVVAHRITHLGAGQLPEPLHATWAQLVNGSLDTQYAEIDGVVTAVHDQQMVMLTEGRKITLELTDFEPETLAGYEGAVVRIRGCAFAFFNQETRELEASLLRVLGGAVQILQLAPRDVFDAPQKSIGDLLLYDPKAAPYRRLKVAGQVMYGRAGEFFINDGTNGMHVITRTTDSFALGDLVEAVGFVDLAGPAAELKEAVMRRTGRGPLPTPIKLAPEHLLLGRYDGALVQVDATLMNQWREGPQYVQDLQSGFVAFRARSDTHGPAVASPPSGSRLQLTGIYAPMGTRATDGTVSGFEMHLNSPLGIRVLSTPPWWTLERVAVLAAILTALLCAVLIWNKALQRKVQERGRQLESEIRVRQQAELRHAAEAERSRIARDLHDELGTGLTEVSLLASTGVGGLAVAEKNTDRFRVIADKARALVSSLDVIVWAIDPKRNSLQSFADYLGRYATELFAASDVACRFKIPLECDAVTLSETARHSLFLAVKEALNNVIRHASATEVELQISQVEDRLQIVIADNGRGFEWNTIRRGNGLTNLDERLKALNGQCQIESQLGKGATVNFIIPLPHDPP